MFRRGSWPRVKLTMPAERLEAEQIAAVEAIVAELTPAAVVDYALDVEQSGPLGVAIALSAITADVKEALLAEAFARGPGNAERFAQGMLFGFKRNEGDSALRGRMASAIAEGRPTLDLLSIAFTLDPNRQNWTLIASAGEEVERAYWRRLNVFAVPVTEELDWISEKFLAVERVSRCSH
jgi:hypothetical protein